MGHYVQTTEEEIRVKKLIILTVAVLSISACSTTPNEIRATGPDQVFSSEKDAKDVSSCVADKWVAWINKFEDWGVVESVEIADGYAVTAQRYGPDPDDGSARKPASLNYLADVENQDSGSVTKLYQHLSFNFGENPFFVSVAECQ
jgi:uncharacterized ubiquitin-like protein YukD